MAGGEFVAVADSAVDIGGMMVGVTVGVTVAGRFVGAETVRAGVGGITVEGAVACVADVQAVTKMTARMSAII